MLQHPDKGLAPTLKAHDDKRAIERSFNRSFAVLGVLLRYNVCQHLVKRSYEFLTKTSRNSERKLFLEWMFITLEMERVLNVHLTDYCLN